MRYREKIRRFADRKLPHVTRVYRSFRDNYIYASGREYRTSFGFNLIGGHYQETSADSDIETATFLYFLQTTENVIDIGANIGYFSCLSASQNVPCIAFEPHPKNLAVLTHNLRRNHFEPFVEVFPMALGKDVGILSLYGAHTGASLVKGWAGNNAVKSTEVPVNTLDHIVSSRLNGKKLLIKIDVEGSEFAVLEGGRETLSLDPAPVWILEHGLTERFPDSLNPHFLKLFELFWENGYEAYTLSKEPRLVSAEDVRRWIDQRKRDFGWIYYYFIKSYCH